MRRLLLITMAASLSAVALLRADDLVVSRFGDYLDSLRQQAGIPGLAATVIRPEGTWERAFGLQDVERGLQTLADTPFHIDSTTQIVSAAIVLRCVEEGRLSLDDTIGRYAPQVADPGATI